MNAPEENDVVERAARLPFVARPDTDAVVVIEEENPDGEIDVVERAGRLPFVARPDDGEPVG